MNILVISGPNLNLLGLREPGIYGAVTLEQIHTRLQQEEADALGCTITCFQSNHEGALIDFMHEYRTTAAGALLNAGGLTHSSVSLHDAIKSVPYPVVEVHLSNIQAREEWRRHSASLPGNPWPGSGLRLAQLFDSISRPGVAAAKREPGFA